MDDSKLAPGERAALESRIDELRALAIRLETGSRTRRLRISRFLHDDPLQLLAAAKLRLEVMRSAPERLSGDSLEIVEDQVHRALRAIRRLSVELRPAWRAQGYANLPEALESVALRVEAQTAISVELTTRTHRRPADDELCETLCEVVEEVLREADDAGPTRLAIDEDAAGDLTVEIDGSWSDLDVSRPRCRLELRGARLDADEDADGRLERLRLVVPAALLETAAVSPAGDAT